MPQRRSTTLFLRPQVKCEVLRKMASLSILKLISLRVSSFLQVVAVGTANSEDRAAKFIESHNISNAKAYGSYAELFQDQNVGQSANAFHLRMCTLLEISESKWST